MVTVTKNKTTGLVFTVNPELGKDGKQYGYYRVSEKFLDNSGAISRIKERSALKSISVDEYNKGLDHTGKHLFIFEGAQLEGRVRTIESLVQEKGMKPKMAGSGPDALPCLYNDQQIYFKTELDTNGEADVLIEHTNGAEISAAAKAKANAAAIND
jgi:hypothetical protein